MKLIEKCIFCLRYLDRSIYLFFLHMCYALAKRIGFMELCFYRCWQNATLNAYKKILKHEQQISYFDFNGAKIVDISNNKEMIMTLNCIFPDIFYISCFCNDNYEKYNVEYLDKYLPEGSYCYQDLNGIDVRISSGDIVIDAGAWIGDFSAYAASKGAISYAFEPVTETYNLLSQTAKLNNNKIIPVKLGLGDKKEKLKISTTTQNSGGSSLLTDYGENFELVEITTLDEFVTNNKLEKIDFIKSDIEGFERNLLKGAKNVLAKFAPKLAICTYHYPDDPQILEKLILEANPKYTIVHLRHKLVAQVIVKK